MKRLNKLILSIMSASLSLVLITSGVLYYVFGKTSGENVGGGSTEPIPEQKGDQNIMLIKNEEFLSPINKYRFMPIIHDFLGVKGATYADKIQTILSTGAGGFITNDAWTSQYLINDRKLGNLDEFIKEATKAGLRIWIYDEKGYPSGSAGDLVCKDNPEYQAINLLQSTISGTGSGEKALALPADFIKLNSVTILSNGKYSQAEASVKDNKIVFNGVDGEWTAYVYYVAKYVHNNDWSKTYPNLLNKEAVRKFIDVTYERYAAHIENFGDIVEAFFTDEPFLTATTHANYSGNSTDPAIPYDYDIFETFKEKYGYDIVPLLPHVFNLHTVEAQRARAHFYSHVGDILSDSFYGQIQEWCEAHGTKFSGHNLLEEQMKYHIPLYGDYMQCSAAMGYPGFDILDVRPDSYIKNMSTGGKYASSPAWLNNVERVFVEICPVVDSSEFATNHLDYALGTMTFAYFDGGNQIGSYYGKANNEPETGNVFSEYVGRLGSMLVGAQSKNEVAVYYAIDSVAAAYTSPQNRGIYSSDQLARLNDKLVTDVTLKLRENGLDYVFLDDASLQGGTVNKDSLTVGNFNFKTIIVPRATIIDIKTMRILDQLIANGVNVIFIGGLPSLAWLESDQAELEGLSKKHQSSYIFTVDQLMGMVTTTCELTIESRHNVYVSPYEKDGVKFFYLANASTSNADVTFKFEGAVRYRVYDAVTGDITEVDSSYNIPSYRGIFVQPIVE